jgi:hypothetical protein
MELAFHPAPFSNAQKRNKRKKIEREINGIHLKIKGFSFILKIKSHIPNKHGNEKQHIKSFFIKV